MRTVHFMAMSIIISVSLGCHGQRQTAAPAPAFDPNRCFYHNQQGKQIVIDEFHSPEHFSSGPTLNCTSPLPMDGLDCYMEASSDVGGGFRWEVRGAYEVTNIYTSRGDSVMWFACPKSKPCDAPAHDNVCGEWENCCRVQADFGK